MDFAKCVEIARELVPLNMIMCEKRYEWCERKRKLFLRLYIGRLRAIEITK